MSDSKLFMYTFVAVAVLAVLIVIAFLINPENQKPVIDQPKTHDQALMDSCNRFFQQRIVGVHKDQAALNAFPEIKFGVVGSMDFSNNTCCFAVGASLPDSNSYRESLYNKYIELKKKYEYTNCIFFEN